MNLARAAERARSNMLPVSVPSRSAAPIRPRGWTRARGTRWRLRRCSSAAGYTASRVSTGAPLRGSPGCWWITRESGGRQDGTSRPTCGVRWGRLPRMTEPYRSCGMRSRVGMSRGRRRLDSPSRPARILAPVPCWRRGRTGPRHRRQAAVLAKPERSSGGLTRRCGRPGACARTGRESYFYQLRFGATAEGKWQVEALPQIPPKA